MLSPHQPALILAPMEGVTDGPMRAMQGASGAFTFAVTEFLRVAQMVPPRFVLERHVPELLNGCRTPSGLPVQVQLLGGHAERLAQTALSAVEAGATAIDMNFGCPARTVNRHDGGATLLQHPERIREIVAAIRQALPPHVPVSAKIRLGWDRVDQVFENAAMAEEGGAAWVTVHARTRTQGYAPPVYWPLVGRVREQLRVPVVANGDIRTLDDFRRCREESGCIHFMLGRGALANPRLAPEIARELGIERATSSPFQQGVDWLDQMRQLVHWTRIVCGACPERTVFRMKQWLKLAATFGDFRRFDAIKRARTVEELMAILGGHSLAA